MKMKPIIKTILKKAFPKYSLYYRAFNHLVINQNSYLHTTGWLRSLQGNKPVDQDGYEVPWMNYAVIKFLKERLSKNFHVFEFGSGYSTLFYARLVNRVTSVEDDEVWFQLVEKSLPENVELIYKQADIDAQYCRVISSSGRKYDVVVVDGRDRVNCIKQGLGALSEGGVILLDDSKREEYVDGINYLKETGFRAISFEGLKPTNPRIERTTIFYRSKNCLDI